MPETLQISVIGTGYLGATHAAAMAEMGYDVVGIDVDADKVAALNDGAAPFYEPGLDELVAAQIAAGRLRFTTDFAEAADCDVHFICVGTPQTPGSNAADMRFVFAAADELAPHLTGPRWWSGRAPCPSAPRLRSRPLLQGLAPAGDAVHLAWNPEFLREGYAVADTLRPDRIVVGTERPGRRSGPAAGLRPADWPTARPSWSRTSPPRSWSRLPPTRSSPPRSPSSTRWPRSARPLAATCGPWPTRSATTNGSARKFLGAGIGFGGGCLPKDIRAFMARAGELGVGAVVGVPARGRRDQHAAARTGARRSRRSCSAGSPLGARVAVLGVAFKPDSDDIRDSPALNVAAGPASAGGAGQGVRPQGDGQRGEGVPHPQLRAGHDHGAGRCRPGAAADRMAASSAISIRTRSASRWQRRNIVDGRNVLDPAAWRAAGWTYRGIGRR